MTPSKASKRCLTPFCRFDTVLSLLEAGAQDAPERRGQHECGHQIRVGVRAGHPQLDALGARLARLEAEIAFTTLLSRFPRMALAVDPGALRWGRGDGLVLRGLSTLPVLLSPPQPQETSA